MKKECVCCKKSMGMLNSKVKLSDGFVCTSCWEAAGFGSDLASFSSGEQMTAGDFMARYKKKKDIEQAAKVFKPTNRIGASIAFDDQTNTFLVTTISGFKTFYDIFEYSQIVDFELLEDGESITKGGLGRAVAGGVLFGGVGAVVGAATGGKKTKSICNSMRIKITLRNAYAPVAYVDFIKSATKQDSHAYQQARKNAQEALSALQIAVDKCQAVPATQNAPASAADEILKFKQLMDTGVISQDEFDAKKKQLLGL